MATSASARMSISALRARSSCCVWSACASRASSQILQTFVSALASYPTKTRRPSLYEMGERGPSSNSLEIKGERFFGARKIGIRAPSPDEALFILLDAPLREPSACVMPNSDKMRRPSSRTAQGMLASPSLTFPLWVARGLPPSSLSFSHRAWPPALAISDRSCGVRRSARAAPPLLCLDST